MLKVGLTGSIAAGKSFVCKRFRELGCHVLDADVTAREVVAVGTPGLAAIVKTFGSGILNDDGSLDRKRLGSIVFANAEKRAVLNSIVHPLVFAEQDRWLQDVESRDPHGIAIIDAALMIESGGYKRFNKLIVVWCEPAIQLQRLMMRDRIDEKTARERVAAQMSQDEKKRFADILIDTSGDKQSVIEAVDSAFNNLRSAV